MKPVLHIGPSKTASTSIQAVIPKLGRPYLIKPKWAKIVAKAREFEPPGRLADVDGLIFSDEGLGDFTHHPPEVIARRLSALFGPSVVVYIHRDLSERLRSMYNQTIKNNGPFPGGYATFEENERKVYPKGRGVFIGDDLARLHAAFSAHELRVVPFALLKEDPDVFLKAFCDACEAFLPATSLPHLNKTA